MSVARNGPSTSKLLSTPMHHRASIVLQEVTTAVNSYLGLDLCSIVVILYLFASRLTSIRTYVHIVLWYSSTRPSSMCATFPTSLSLFFSWHKTHCLNCLLLSRTNTEFQFGPILCMAVNLHYSYQVIGCSCTCTLLLVWWHDIFGCDFSTAIHEVTDQHCVCVCLLY